MIENDDVHEYATDAESPTTEPTGLESILTEYVDQPDECTVYPIDATETELLTTWITATEGAFVDLADAR